MEPSLRQDVTIDDLIGHEVQMHNNRDFVDSISRRRIIPHDTTRGEAVDETPLAELLYGRSCEPCFAH